MTNLTNQGIVDIYNNLHKENLTLKLAIAEKKDEIQNLEAYQTLSKELKDLETELLNVTNKENELLEQGKKYMISAGIKKFEGLNGEKVQLDKKPGKLIIENEDNLDDMYIKSKITTSIDKTLIKKHIKEGVIVDGCYIEEDYKLVIK